MAGIDIPMNNFASATNCEYIYIELADGSQGKIKKSDLLGAFFQAKDNVTRDLDSYIESGIYGINKDNFNPGFTGISWGMLIVFSGPGLGMGGSPVIQLVIDTYTNPFIWMRTKWLASWTGWQKILLTI